MTAICSIFELKHGNGTRPSQWVIASVIVLVSSMAFADKLEDFKKARSETGCKAIPYSDLQDNCSRQQDPIHDWCDGGKGPISCGSEGTSRSLQEAIEKEKKNNESLKQKKRDLDDKRSKSTSSEEKSKLSSGIEATDKEIYESGKAIDKVNDDLSKRQGEGVRFSV